MSAKNPYGKWLAEQFKSTGKKKGDLAIRWKKEAGAVSKVISGERDMSAEEYATAQEFFAEVASGPGVGATAEIDVRGGLGGGGVTIEDVVSDGNGGTFVHERVLQHWTLPDQFVRGELRTKKEDIRIIEVLGDSMDPTLRSGDRIIIDTAHRVPSPPGVFAVYDGVGVVVKRIELVPNTAAAKVRLISDNKNHQNYEVSTEEAHIIGRVICKISLM